jgi:hypothetical protein
MPIIRRTTMKGGKIPLSSHCNTAGFSGMQKSVITSVRLPRELKLRLPQDEGGLLGEGRLAVAHVIPAANMAVRDTRMHVDHRHDHKCAQVVYHGRRDDARWAMQHIGSYRGMRVSEIWPPPNPPSNDWNRSVIPGARSALDVPGPTPSSAAWRAPGRRGFPVKAS